MRKNTKEIQYRLSNIQQTGVLERPKCRGGMERRNRSKLPGANRLQRSERGSPGRAQARLRVKSSTRGHITVTFQNSQDEKIPQPLRENVRLPTKEGQTDAHQISDHQQETQEDNGAVPSKPRVSF